MTSSIIIVIDILNNEFPNKNPCLFYTEKVDKHC